MSKTLKKIISSHNQSYSLLRNRLDENPFDAGLLIEMGALLFANGKASDAMLYLMRATIRKPDNPSLLMNIGFCLNALSIHGEAVRYFQAALDLGSTHTRLLEKMCESLGRIGKYSEIDSLLDQYKKTALNSRRLLLLCVANYHSMKNYEDAAELADRARGMNLKNTYTSAAADTIKAALNHQTGRKTTQKLRVAFHLNEQFHYAIMKPIFDALKHHYEVVMTSDPIWVKKFDPDLVFVANRQAVNLRKLFPTAKFVYTRHGLISKNFVYDAARSCDFVCVSSEDQQKQFVEEGKFREEKVWVTGYSQMDPLFRDEPPTVELPLRPDHKCVLYAPTFTRGLSSIPMMLPHMTKAFFNEMKDVDFVIKTHPLTQKTSGEWVIKLQEIAQTFEHVHLVDDIAADIVPLLSGADVLISDVSSVMFQFLALDRPIIALNNPDRLQVKEYDPSGIEWRWRDMATEINNMIDLSATIKACLSDPSKNKKIRETYRNSLFGTMTEGKTGERVLGYVQKLSLLEERNTRD